jgi:hypothetical protein
MTIHWRNPAVSRNCQELWPLSRCLNYHARVSRDSRDNAYACFGPFECGSANPDPKPMLDCDRGPIFIRVGRAGAITVDGMTTDEGSIERRLGGIFQTRAEKLIYFEAGSYQCLSEATLFLISRSLWLPVQSAVKPIICVSNIESTEGRSP